MTDREGRAGAWKRLSKTCRPSIQEIVVAVERVAAGEKSRKVVVRTHKVEIDAHLERVAAPQIGQVGHRLVSRRIRKSRAEIVCAESQSVNDVDLRPCRICKAWLSVPHKIETNLSHHIGAERTIVNSSEVVGVHFVIPGVFLSDVRTE